VSYPFGENTGGIIMYDASGYMAVQIIRNDRPAFASEDMFDAAPEELKTAFEGINSYFGRFEVDVKQGIVIHHVEAASLPNRHGSHQVRQYEFSGNRLILKTPPRLLNGQMLTGILIWERIEAT
jgi:hypothetical protein